MTPLLALALLLSPTPQSPSPSAELVDSTCTALEAGFDATPEEAAAALAKAVDVLHPRVIALIERKGLRHDDLGVRSRSVEALGHMQHKDALDALHGMHKRDRKRLDDEPVLLATLLREIARHGDSSSIDILTKDLFGMRDKQVIRTRILGLGRIRTEKSVHELIQLMRSTRAGRANDYLADFRLALVALTGVDKGENFEHWINWYGDAERGLEISPKMAPLPKPLDRRWRQFWGEKEEDEGDDGQRGKKKKKRGRDE